MGYGGIERKAKISVQLVKRMWWSTEGTGKRDIPPYVVGVREALVRRKLVKSQNLRTTCFGKVVGYGENREKRDSSVRSEGQDGDGTEEMGEKPKSPYNLFWKGGGVRRESGKEGFLRT